MSNSDLYCKLRDAKWRIKSVGLRVKNEVWGGQGGGGWYHKFVYECNRIPLVTEGCMQNFITLVQPPLLLFSQKNVTHPLGEGGEQIQI